MVQLTLFKVTPPVCKASPIEPVDSLASGRAPLESDALQPNADKPADSPINASKAAQREPLDIRIIVKTHGIAREIGEGECAAT
jgi:hypothetical protein